MCKKLNQMLKNIWNVDCGVWRANISTEHKFNCGITGITREDFSDDVRPGRRSMSITDENIKESESESE